MHYRKTARPAEYYHILILLLLILGLSGCAGPVGVSRVSPQESYKHITANALGAGKMSDSTKTVLQRYNLFESLDDDPLQTIRTLQDIGKTDDRRDILFALSELCYLQGGKLLATFSGESRSRAQDVFLQSAVYAYFYLLDNGREAPPTAYDIRFREACDLYNRSLWQAFPVNDKSSLNLSDGVRHLPGGDLLLVVRTDTLAWNYHDFEGLYPSDGFAVRGFTVRDRTAGLGLPLVGLTRKTVESPGGSALPITALLRVSGDFSNYLRGEGKAVLELYSALDDSEVHINGRPVPLETDITTPLAYKLEGSPLWNIGLRSFITGAGIHSRLLLIQPYEPGRIPVVFVHGTASSPVWWAEMFNSLRADPEIRKNFQFWFYQYNSSKMMALSAAELRESIVAMVNQLDPQRKDPALQNMVVIGHSQGGLLTKMTAVDPGDTLWHAISDENIEKMDIDPTLKDFARRLIIFKPLPFVTRVVFISTPHRGSYLTKDWVRSLVRRLVSLPVNVVLNSPEFLTTLGTRFKLPASMHGKIPTSIDGMSDDNPLLKGLVSLPIEPGVAAHSIISVKPGMDIVTGNDGVVEYQSAHIDGVESEFVVRSEHSCQSHPFTIEEVRRILLKHIGIDNAWQAPAEKIPAPSASVPLPGSEGSEQET